MNMLNKRTINRVAKPEREIRCIKALRDCQSTSRRRHGTPREGSRAVPGDGGEAGLWGAVPGDGREQEEHAGPWGQRKEERLWQAAAQDGAFLGGRGTSKRETG